MKFIATFALFFCVISNTLAEAPQCEDDQANSAMVTSGAYLIGRFCRIGPLDTVIGVGVAKGTAAGLKKYKETSDMAIATRVAAEEGFAGAAGVVTKGIGAIIIGATMVKDIKDGKDINDAYNDRAKETVDYIKKEVMNNPKGDLARSLVTGANVAVTWTFGPIPAFVAATLAKAAADGMQKYKETKDVNKAAEEAYKSGYKSTASVVRAVCGLIASGTGLAQDIASGKNKSTALRERGSQALNSILGRKTDSKTDTPSETSKKDSASDSSHLKNVPSIKKGSKK